jgi:hypothetical protein
LFILLVENGAHGGCLLPSKLSKTLPQATKNVFFFVAHCARGDNRKLYLMINQFVESLQGTINNGIMIA